MCCHVYCRQAGCRRISGGRNPRNTENRVFEATPRDYASSSFFFLSVCSVVSFPRFETIAVRFALFRIIPPPLQIGFPSAESICQRKSSSSSYPDSRLPRNKTEQGSGNTARLDGYKEADRTGLKGYSYRSHNVNDETVAAERAREMSGTCSRTPEAS